MLKVKTIINKVQKRVIKTVSVIKLKESREREKCPLLDTYFSNTKS